MHRAPSRASRNAKKNRTCGKQVLSVVTMWFKSAETPVHQAPIQAVPMHEISPLFALQSQSHDIPRPQYPQAIPIKSLHDISPLFPRLDDRIAPTIPQAEYPFPRAATNLLMPQPLRPVKLRQYSLRPVVYPHDSFLFRAKRANLEPVWGGEAEEYYRETAEYRGIPTVRPASQRRPLSDCSDGTWRDSTDLNAVPMARQATERRPISDCSSASEDTVYFELDGNDTYVDSQSITSIPMVKPAAQRRPLSDISSASDATVESDWQNKGANLFSRGDDFRTKHLAVLDKETHHNAVLVGATTRQSVAAELCWASDSDSDCSATLSSSPRRDSFSVYVHSSPSTQDDNAVENRTNSLQRTVQEPTYAALDDIPCVEASDVYQEWTALLMRGEDQACLARFAHLWEDTNAEPVDQSLFTDLDGDFTQRSSTDDPKGSRPLSDRFDSLPTADRLREAFLKRNAEHPDTEAYPDKRPDVLFKNFISCGVVGRSEPRTLGNLSVHVDRLCYRTLANFF
jgi:hypothetical protein